MEEPQKKSCREPDCGFEMPLGEQHCPHCGRPRLFPNVDMASTEDEQKGLDRRYQKTLRAARKNKADDACRAFEAFVTEKQSPLWLAPCRKSVESRKWTPNWLPHSRVVEKSR
jgi:hypothetical protein